MMKSNLPWRKGHLPPIEPWWQEPSNAPGTTTNLILLKYARKKWRTGKQKLIDIHPLEHFSCIDSKHTRTREHITANARLVKVTPSSKWTYALDFIGRRSWCRRRRCGRRSGLRRCFRPRMGSSHAREWTKPLGEAGETYQTSTRVRSSPTKR